MTQDQWIFLAICEAIAWTGGMVFHILGMPTWCYGAMVAVALCLGLFHVATTPR